MVSNCANPACGKPLHYLREGRIYVFDASAGTALNGAKRERRLEHYWLCGTCAAGLALVQDPQGWIRIVPKSPAIPEIDDCISMGSRSGLAS